MKKSLAGQILSRFSFPLVVIIFISGFYFNAKDMDPMASNYPITLIFLVACLILAIIFQEIRDILKTTKTTFNEKKATFHDWWVEWHKTVYTIVALFLYIFLVDTLGFFVSTGLFMMSTFLLLGYRKIISMIVMVSITLTVSYFLFSVIFRLPLPSGIFF